MTVAFARLGRIFDEILDGVISKLEFKYFGERLDLDREVDLPFSICHLLGRYDDFTPTSFNSSPR